MNNTLKEVVDAINAVIHNTPFDITISDEHQFYQICHENGLSGMIFSVLNPRQFSTEIYAKMQKDYYAYIAKDTKQLKLIHTLKLLFDGIKCKHIFLKGSHLKNVYPSTYMRSMGDIDVLIDSTLINPVKSLLKKNHFKLTSSSEAHDCFLSLDGLQIEVHPQLTMPIDDRFDGLFMAYWSHASLIDDYTYQFNPEFETVYLLVHMIKHFRSSGVGLRSVLDIGLFIRHYEAFIDIQKLDALIQEGHLMQFFTNMIKLNRHYFQLNILSDYIDSTPLDADFLHLLTHYIVTSGVHGTGMSFNNFIGRMTTVKRENKTTLGYIFRIVFPSFNQMKGMYPLLRSLPFLLPFFWMVRAVKLVFFRTRRSLHRLKQIKNSKKSVETTTALYDKLGI